MHRLLFPSITVKLQRRKLEDSDAVRPPIVLCKQRTPVTPGRFRNQSSCFHVIQTPPNQSARKSSATESQSSGVEICKYSRIPLTGPFRSQWFQPFPEDFISSPPTVRKYSQRLTEDSRHCSVPVSKADDTFPPSPPCFRRRFPTNSFLPLRPTVEKTTPLHLSDDLFQLFVKAIPLQGLPFDSNLAAIRFYQSHFPLLLSTVDFDRERTPTPLRKRRTPESPMLEMIARKKALKEKITELEVALEEIENEEGEEGTLITELYDDTFNPCNWYWNRVVDTHGMNKILTVDQLLKQM